MPLNQLQFGSLLSYCPRGDDREEIQRSREIMTFVKNDSFIEDPPIPMSEWIARTMEQRRNTLPFTFFFQSNTVLVPLPKSSLLRPNSLWVPDRIANALVANGFGARVLRCLVRETPIRRSSISPPELRPSPSEHFHSIAVQGNLESAQDIVLVDDIVTRGHTMLGSAWRLLEAFPAPHLRAFAAIRTTSNPADFSSIYDPRVGSISYRQDFDDCIRDP